MIDLNNVYKYNFLLSIIIVSLCASLIICNINIKAQKNENSMLIDKIIYIDAGHGGKDNGACVDNVLEDSINLAISNYLLEELMDAGAYVLTSRTNDYDLASMYQKNRKREDLNNRVKYINNSKPDIFISIHLNTYPSNSVSGGQTFYQNNDKSKALAETIQNNLNKINKKDKKSKKGDYFILNNSKPVGVLVECGFLSNNDEREKLTSEKYQRQIARIIKVGIVDYFNL